MSQPSAVRDLWFRWKALRLPWRKKWLCGHDLNGTTFWEFRVTRSVLRPRRIAQPPSSIPHHALRLSPAWIQWLRHTRVEPPSVPEQLADVQRIEQLQTLALAADQRWQAKESYLAAPAAAAPAATTSSGMLPGETTIGLDALARQLRPNGEAQQQPSLPATSVSESPPMVKQTAADTARRGEKTPESASSAETDPWAAAARARATQTGPSGEWAPTSWEPRRVDRGA